MSESDSRAGDQIERLEDRIEELREAIRRSRRLAAAGRLCAVVGVAWLVGLLFGFVTSMPLGFVSAIALGLGGLVLMGSSVGSTRQLELFLRRAAEERNAAIDALRLKAIQDGGQFPEGFTSHEA